MPDEKPLDIVRLRAWVKGRIERSVPDARIDYCLTCGLCASGCPATGIDGLDPRKFLRLLVLGQDDEILKTNWIYTCTMCQRCRYACPMGIDVGRIVYEIRGMRPRDERPRNLQRSCDLQKETNSTGIPNEDFVWVVRDVLEEVRQNEPEWADINAPIDKAGAEYYLNQNAKEPTVEPEEMVPLWKILHAAGIDWTYSSKW
ncbi:MAG: 4Fe-4S dicluster domain-containing protein, partial [Dissulfurimicrobium sp.]